MEFAFANRSSRCPGESNTVTLGDMPMGLFENIQKEKVKDLNLRNPVLAKPDDRVRDVVQAMRSFNLGCAVVVDEERKPVGMFTESMLTQLLANRPESIHDNVGSHCANRWPQVSLDDPVASVLEALKAKNVRFLAVVDNRGRIVGLTGQKGLMEYVADHFPQVAVQKIVSNVMITREGA